MGQEQEGGQLRAQAGHTCHMMMYHNSVQFRWHPLGHFRTHAPKCQPTCCDCCTHGHQEPKQRLDSNSLGHSRNSHTNADHNH